VLDASGNIYCVTSSGGASASGTVFEITPSAESVIHSFGNSPDGAVPSGGLVFGRTGNLYGTTTSGGNTEGDGTVFELTPSGNT
jgi:uncharacterized repeat protein (TIGR03803 family)